MLQFLLDTDHLTCYERLHAPPIGRLQRHAREYGLSAISVEECLKGRLAYIAQARNGPQRIYRYGLLLDTLQVLHHLPLVAYHQASETEFQRFRSLRIRVGTQDLKIAAIAVASRLTLLTCNRRHFSHVPGLLFDDWTV